MQLKVLSTNETTEDTTNCLFPIQLVIINDNQANHQKGL